MTPNKPPKTRAVVKPGKKRGRRTVPRHRRLVKANIRLEVRQCELLDQLADFHQTSPSQLVRMMIDDHAWTRGHEQRIRETTNPF